MPYILSVCFVYWKAYTRVINMRWILMETPNFAFALTTIKNLHVQLNWRGEPCKWLFQKKCQASRYNCIALLFSSLRYSNLEFLHKSAESIHQLFNAVCSFKPPFPWEVWGNGWGKNTWIQDSLFQFYVSILQGCILGERKLLLDVVCWTICCLRAVQGSVALCSDLL